MTRKKDRGITDSLLLEVYYSQLGSVEKTLKELRKRGHTFGNALMRKRLRLAVENHLEEVKATKAGSKDPTPSVPLKDGNYFLTAAQNNTKVHRGLFKTIQRFCKDNKAQLLVAKFTYKKFGFMTPTSDSDSPDIWYDPCLLPYLVNEQKQLGDFIFYANFDILPTAVNPLSGLESHSGTKDCAFPHAKLNMHSVPTLAMDKAKFMYTTGACTLLNYIPKKSGQKAELHHVFGGLFVRVRGGKTTVIPISAEENTGHFSVYDKYWTPDGSTRKDVFAINFGDIHKEKLDAEYDVQIRKEIGRLQPQHVFLHDVLDFEARNHHETKDKFSRFKKYSQGKDSVEKNVLDLIEWLNSLATDFPDVLFHVVPSNHNDALYKWANATQPDNDYPNAEFYHFVNYIKLKHLREGGDADDELIPLIAEERDIFIDGNVIFHNRNESVNFFNIEFNLHGDLGANGARGNPRGYARLGFKANTGHTHSCSIVNGIYTAGVAGKLYHGYNKGLSSWSNGFIITYANGKRTILTGYK